MSVISEHTELGTRFNTIWNNRTPVAWPNVQFTPPVKTGNAEWVKFHIIDNTEGQQLTIGSGLNVCRFAGVIIVQVFSNLGIGNLVALTRANEVATILGKWSGTNIVCGVAAIKEIGEDGNGWYQVNCVIPFHRDELL